eukprot:351697-Chlamydomonas_euryale.AAC.10
MMTELHNPCTPPMHACMHAQRTGKARTHCPHHQEGAAVAVYVQDNMAGGACIQCACMRRKKLAWHSLSLTPPTTTWWSCHRFREPAAHAQAKAQAAAGMAVGQAMSHLGVGGVIDHGLSVPVNLMDKRFSNTYGLDGRACAGLPVETARHIAVGNRLVAPRHDCRSVPTYQTRP